MLSLKTAEALVLPWDTFPGNLNEFQRKGGCHLLTPLPASSGSANDELRGAPRRADFEISKVEGHRGRQRHAISRRLVIPLYGRVRSITAPGRRSRHGSGVTVDVTHRCRHLQDH